MSGPAVPISLVIEMPYLVSTEAEAPTPHRAAKRINVLMPAGPGIPTRTGASMPRPRNSSSQDSTGAASKLNWCNAFAEAQQEWRAAQVGTAMSTAFIAINERMKSVKATRTSKTGKTQYTNFEIFRARESAVPVDSLEQSERVVAFAFEPNGDRFAVVRPPFPFCNSYLCRVLPSVSESKRR